MTRKKLFFYCFIVLGAIAICVGFFASQVDQTLTKSDLKSFNDAFGQLELQRLGGVKYFENFDEEIEAIRAIQLSVFKIASETRPLPKNQSREPADLIAAGYGNCNDRSRYLEKFYRLVGFETRYASLYSTDKTGSALKSLMIGGGDLVRSHALVEVKTRKGWMFVDSVTPFVGLNDTNEPIALEKWQNIQDKKNYKWSKQPANSEIYPLMNNDFTYIYGLYSRHGRFYPPYVPVPDVDWMGVWDNF